MIPESRQCSGCGGVEFHIIPTDENGKPTGAPDRWECERCGRIRNHWGEILVPGNPAARRNA
ncbi:MAG: hypothetical protein JRC86_13435 [Deltaproteobacteria bacterium]|nr:hypothetical protein [Deltaproteobacteria bacterium]